MTSGAVWLGPAAMPAAASSAAASARVRVEDQASTAGRITSSTPNNPTEPFSASYTVASDSSGSVDSIVACRRSGRPLLTSPGFTTGPMGRPSASKRGPALGSAGLPGSGSGGRHVGQKTLYLRTCSAARSLLAFDEPIFAAPPAGAMPGSARDRQPAGA